MKHALVSAVSFALLAGCGASTPPPPATVATSPASVATTTLDSAKLRGVSADEIRGYTEGRALRFGRAAEKNHNPSPYYILKYKSELALFDEQLTPARAILERERSQASRLGKELLADETKLETLLSTPGSREDLVADMTREIARLEGEIRLVHLEADVAAKKLLNSSQQVQYDAVRSYDPEEDGRDAMTHDGNCATRP
ncbi:MAG: hypothetical protein ACRELY_23030 [Polyangiaceae bacterium]